MSNAFVILVLCVWSYCKWYTQVRAIIANENIYIIIFASTDMLYVTRLLATADLQFVYDCGHLEIKHQYFISYI